MEHITENKSIHIQGDRSEVAQALNEFGIPIVDEPVNESVLVAVFTDKSRETSLYKVNNAEIICLINFENETADELTKYYGASVFNFADLTCCIDFLACYYFAYELNIQNLDIYDISYLLGHKNQSSAIIRSNQLNCIEDIPSNTSALLCFNFSDKAIDEYENYSNAIVQKCFENGQEIYLLGDRTDRCNLNKIFYLSNEKL